MRGDGASDAAALLTQVDERLQRVVIGRSTVVLSVYDALTLGTERGVTARWKTGDPTQLVYLFAEVLGLAGTFSANGGVVAARTLTASGAPVLDVAGAPGHTPAASPGGLSITGGEGGPGGDLSLYLEDVDPTAGAPRIIAHGGQGGGGQPGDATKDGGGGGTGGTGGHVIAVVSHPAGRWLAALKAAYALTDAVKKQHAVQQLSSTLPAGSSPALLRSIRDRLAAAVAGPPTIDQLNSAIDQAGLEIALLLDLWKSELVAGLDVSGGAPGVHGAGRSDGAAGSPGGPGTATVQVLGQIDDLPLAFLVHPSQCAMLLAKAKLAFLFLDPIRNPRGVADAATLLDRVRARTELFATLADDSALARFYADHEAAYGAVNAVGTLRSLNAEAKMYLSYLKMGLDFFGYSSDYVPLTSLTAIAQSGVTPIFNAFKSIEGAYRKQFAQLREDQQTLDHVRDTRREIQSLTQQANVDIPQLITSLTSAATIIDGYQAVLPDKREAVRRAFEDYRGDLSRNFEIPWQTLLGALGQCAFAPESAAMYAVQAASVLYAGTTTVTDIQGQPVRKDFLVQQIKAIDATVGGLKEGFETLDDGALRPEDPGAGKLIAAEGQLEALLSQLYGKFPEDARALRDAFQDLVSAVIARNNQVLSYNAALTLVVQYTELKRQAQVQAQALDDSVLESLQADAPGLTSFISQAYYSTRNQVLEFMDLAARAYRFWALQEGDLLRDALAGLTPPQIDSVALDRIQSNFWATYTRALGDVGGMQVFPADPADRRGETFVVSGAAIDTFQQTHELLVEVPLSKKESSAGPFLNMSNVRVTRVRAYVHGAKTDSGELNVSLMHTGKERIVSRRNQVFRFQHGAIPATFKYVIATEYIRLDPTFEVAASASTDLALIGPFTFWHITVDPRYNEGLDLSGVTSVELDFRGYSQGYD